MPQLARSGVNNNGSGVRRKSRVSDASDIGGALGFADADGIQFASSNARVADIDVVAGRSDIGASGRPHCNSNVALGHVGERIGADGNVATGDCGVMEVKERSLANGHVELAGRVAIERLNTDAHIVGPVRVTYERCVTDGRIRKAVAVMK